MFFFKESGVEKGYIGHDPSNGALQFGDATSRTRIILKEGGNTVFTGNTIDFNGQEIRHASYNPFYINGNDTIQFRINTNSTGGSGVFGVNRGNDNARLFTIKDGGSVGIGTTNPLANLQVVGSTRTDRLSFGTSDTSGATSDYYSIRREVGAWSYPYPDLVIQYHTGIKYDAYQGYGGHQFFTGYNGTGNPSGLVMQITDKVYVNDVCAAGGKCLSTAGGGSLVCNTQSAPVYPNTYKTISCLSGYTLTGCAVVGSDTTCWVSGNGCRCYGYNQYWAPSGQATCCKVQ